MDYCSYKRFVYILMKAGWIICSDDMELVPADREKYGDGIDNSYPVNLYDMIADYTEQLQDT